MFKGRRLVSELMGRKGSSMLGWQGEGIRSLEMVSGKCMRIESLEMAARRNLTSMHAAF
jgi:hypothetical protein